MTREERIHHTWGRLRRNERAMLCLYETGRADAYLYSPFQLDKSPDAVSRIETVDKVTFRAVRHREPNGSIFYKIWCEGIHVGNLY